jgi:hypothetical protein
MGVFLVRITDCGYACGIAGFRVIVGHDDGFYHTDKPITQEFSVEEACGLLE